MNTLEKTTIVLAQSRAFAVEPELPGRAIIYEITNGGDTRRSIGIATSGANGNWTAWSDEDDPRNYDYLNIGHTARTITHAVELLVGRIYS